MASAFPPRDLDEFCGMCAAACDQAGTEVNALAMVDDNADEEGIMVAAIEVGDTAVDLAQVFEEMFVGGRTYAALATRVGWSPDEGPVSSAWSLICVEATIRARFYVRRVVEDRDWWRMPVDRAPWFALSTASSLRAKLAGEVGAMIARPFGAPELFNRPGHGALPPLHEDGTL